MEFLIFFSVILVFNNNFCDAIPSKFRIADVDMHPHREKSLTMTTNSINKAELSKEYWLENAKKLVTKKVNAFPNTNKAKNVILFVGDGMGLTTTAAARVVLGGEESILSFENFPHTASSKTYCLDKGVADSACTATSFLHGVKNNFGTIGLNGFAQRSNCVDSNNTRLHTESIAKWAQDETMNVGVVTTTRITHATPAGLYANTAERNWETNVEVIASSCDDHQIDDIAEQLVHGKIGSKFKVILGGGSRNFINSTETEHGNKGMRSDGRNLINEWIAKKSSRKFIRTRAELMDLNDEEEIFGLFSSDHLPFHLDVEDKNLVEIPSLEEMTMKAIEILKKSTKGYFLLVEGGRIDHAHHNTEAKYALDETIEFSKAIQGALESVDLKDTLIVVTSDHSHTLTYAGYAPRHQDIFGYQKTADDNMPYFTLSYANGPSYENHFINGHRVNPSKLNISPLNFRFPATVPLRSETHSGEDVGIWSTGASSYLFSGVLEQTMIPHIMAYALCIGDGLKACDNKK